MRRLSACFINTILALWLPSNASANDKKSSAAPTNESLQLSMAVMMLDSRFELARRYTLRCKDESDWDGCGLLTVLLEMLTATEEVKSWSG